MNARRLGAVVLCVAMGGSALAAQAAFRTVTLGSYASVAELVQAMADQGMGASNRAVSILKTMTVSTAETPLDLVIVSVEDLGLRDHSTFAAIVAAARKRGLDLCPGEAGPLLRLEYTNQAEDNTLRIAMEPVMTGDRSAPTVFMLSGKSLLATDSGIVFDKYIRWVFARR